MKRIAGKDLICLQFVLALVLAGNSISFAQTGDTMYIEGRHLYSAAGEKVILKGVNEMFVWSSDKTGEWTLPEIGKTGSNCVRLVWSASGGSSGLVKLIDNCIANKMIAMPECHDATGDWSKLWNCVYFWKDPLIIEAIKRNKKWTLLNIGNEVGNGSVTSEQFKTEYKEAIDSLRSWGYTVPIVIDASSWGQNADIIFSTWEEIIDHDPLKNILFSVHSYWSSTDNYFRVVEESKNNSLPIIIGEGPSTTAYPQCKILDYGTGLTQCGQNEIGWLSWSWGMMSNGHCVPDFDHTSDGKFGNWETWHGKNLVVEHPYSLMRTTERPASFYDDGIVKVSGAYLLLSESTILEGDSISLEVILSPVNAADKKYSLKITEGEEFANFSSDSLFLIGHKAGKVKIELTHISTGINSIATVDINRELFSTERFIEWNPGIPGGIPEIDEPVRNIVDFGADRNGISDSRKAIVDAMNDLPASGGVVYIPKGTFRVGSKITIGKNNVVFRGEGKNSALLMDFDDHCFEIVTYNSGEWQYLDSDIKKKVLTLSVTNGSAFKIGEYAEIEQDNDPDLMYTQPEWEQSWSENAVGQLFRIQNIEGDQLTFEAPSNIDFSKDLNVRIRPKHLVENVGFEDFYIEKLQSGGNTFLFKNAALCWIKNIESYHTRKSHVGTQASYALEIRDSYFHRSFSYGGGGSGYGVEFGFHTTNCLVENNIFDSLRHAMMVQVGANGNVFGYNYSINPVQGEGETNLNQGWVPPDISIHGHYPFMNLFEGNELEEIGIGDYWGPAGPGNTFFRNKVNGDGIIYYDESHYQNILGNVTTVLRDNDNKSLYKHEHGNVVNGTTIWHPFIVERTLPASLYLDAKPGFFNGQNWPSFGPDKDVNTILPAETRLEELNNPPPSAQDPNFHIYLCFGQSNMEGQGTIESQDRDVDDRFKVFQALDCSNLGRKKATWYTAKPPTCNCWLKLSPADYFGRTMVENLPDSITVGIINVSVGGCDIRLFDKDIYMDYDSTYTESWFTSKVIGYEGNPYKYLMDLARLAEKDGVIKGILMHQGESNTGQTLWPSYVKKIYNNMLADLSLDAESVPLLAGEMLSAPGNCCSSMNTIINQLPDIIPTAYVISSEGCTAQDGAHFDSEGYRTIGKRYAFQMLSLMGYETIYAEAECGTTGGNWKIYSDEEASNSTYATAFPGRENILTPPTDDESSIHLSFSVNAASEYYLYGRFKNASEDDDSFWIKVDDGDFELHDNLTTSGWEWLELKNINLSAGEHTISIAIAEDGAKVDKIAIRSAEVFPTGVGEEAFNVCVPVISSVSNDSNLKGYTLKQNYPNPASENYTNIAFGIPEMNYVSLKVYNSLGIEIEELAGREFNSGEHEVVFNLERLSPGIYFYTLKTDSFISTRKMTIHN